MKTVEKEFFENLIDAWNTCKLENILSFYSDDFELESPIAKAVLGEEKGSLIKGKTNVAEWWGACLKKVPDLTHEFIDLAVASDSSIAMLHKNSHNNKGVVSLFWLNEDGKIKKEIFYN